MRGKEVRKVGSKEALLVTVINASGPENWKKAIPTGMLIPGRTDLEHSIIHQSKIPKL